MAEDHFLLVRMSSLGDIIHTLPAAAALRESYPRARIDWLVNTRWSSLLAGNADINRVICVNRSALGGTVSCLRELRATRYDCALDFQSLYRSAIFSFASGAPRRIGFDRHYAREGLASLFYTEHVHPRGFHKVDHNLSLVEAAGARRIPARFPLVVPVEAEESIRVELVRHGISSYYVLSPGAGWRSKCWPAERFGELHQKLAQRYGWRAVVSFAPEERSLAEKVRSTASNSEPILLPLDLPQLMALLRRARFLVAGDTGPLHLASALGIPVVGLYGPTDPARNGPYFHADIVVRNAKPEETTYRRSAFHSPAMLSITVEQVMDAIERRLGLH